MSERTRGQPGHAGSLGELDLHLFKEGRHTRLYEKLGAHAIASGGVDGCVFRAWAPNARRVSVVGSFNDWQGERTPLAPVGDSGIWEGFAAGVGPGALYKYRVEAQDGACLLKADPYGFHHETPSRTASIVWQLDYDWADDGWMRARRERNSLSAPMSIYEVHLGSFGRHPGGAGGTGSYRELAERLADHVMALGFTHVELLPVMEHPFAGSWGYQVTGYFAPTSRFGSPQDFMALVDTLHRRGIGVILDWVPAHFPGDAHGLARFDGGPLYEHADHRRGYHPDWKSCIFDYGRPEVRSFLLSSALFWLDVYHADGLRVDAVASMLYLDYSRGPGEWLPNEHGGRENLDAVSLLRELNVAVHGAHPDVQTIAEESTAWPMVSRPAEHGGLGFGLKWDMGWMHDTLGYLQRPTAERRHHHRQLTFRGLYAWTESFVLALSHDEVVHGKRSLLGKMPGNDWQRFANLRTLYAYMFAQPGKKLLFMGAELAMDTEWDHDGGLDLSDPHDALRGGVRALVSRLNQLYVTEPALHELDTDPAGFEWIEADDAEHSVLLFLRKARSGEDAVVVAVNFTEVPRHGFRIGVPRRGRYLELLNTDATEYGGSGLCLGAPVNTEPLAAHGRPNSVLVTLPPLGALYLKQALPTAD